MVAGGETVVPANQSPTLDGVNLAPSLSAAGIYDFFAHNWLRTYEPAVDTRLSVRC